MEFLEMNWLAVIAGAVMAFVFGWIMYLPATFGRRWAEGSGVAIDANNAPPVFAMLTQFVALMCLSCVVGVTANADWLFTALLAIFGAAFLVIANGAFCKKSPYALTVDFGYTIGSGALMILAQAVL